jgi:hypothetical protein
MQLSHWRPQWATLAFRSPPRQATRAPNGVPRHPGLPVPNKAPVALERPFRLGIHMHLSHVLTYIIMTQASAEAPRRRGGPGRSAR